jgi:hypothetical protein
MSEYTLLDEGAVILVKDQQIILGRDSQVPVNHGATINAAGDNIVEYQGVTFNRDDINVTGGSSHRVWTAAENAVSHLDIHSGTRKANNTAQYATWDVPLTVPSQGCFRIWCDNFIGDFKINDVVVTAMNARSYDASYAFKVIPGDTMKVKRNSSNVASNIYIYWNFLPYSYTA